MKTSPWGARVLHLVSPTPGGHIIRQGPHLHVAEKGDVPSLVGGRCLCLPFFPGNLAENVRAAESEVSCFYVATRQGFVCTAASPIFHLPVVCLKEKAHRSLYSDFFIHRNHNVWCRKACRHRWTGQLKCLSFYEFK